jgi:hypothetical protein
MSCDICAKVPGHYCMKGNGYCATYGCENMEQGKEYVLEQALSNFRKYTEDDLPDHPPKKPKNPMPPLKLGSYRRSMKKSFKRRDS